MPGLSFEVAAFGDRGLRRNRQTRVSPGVVTAVEHVNIVVAEEFQKPEQPRGSHSGDIVINHDGAIVVDPLSLDQVFDHPKERFERFRPRIDQRDSKYVKASRAWDMTVRVSLRWSQIHENQPGIVETGFQLIYGPEQVWIRIHHRFTLFPSFERGTAPNPEFFTQ